MKIYDKKKFAFGLFWCLLALMYVFGSLSNGFATKNILPSAFLFFISAQSIYVSLSRRLSQKDRLEEMDERNRLIRLTAQSRSFQITQNLCFCLILLSLFLGKQTGASPWIGIGVGLAFAWTISSIIHLVVELFYESRM